jgi:hypothetical protein
MALDTLFEKTAASVGMQANDSVIGVSRPQELKALQGCLEVTLFEGIKGLGVGRKMIQQNGIRGVKLI